MNNHRTEATFIIPKAHSKSHLFQDRRRSEPALVQNIFWNVVSELHEIVVLHKPHKFNVLWAKRFLPIDEAIYESTESIQTRTYMLCSEVNGHVRKVIKGT